MGRETSVFSPVWHFPRLSRARGSSIFLSVNSFCFLPHTNSLFRERFAVTVGRTPQTSDETPYRDSCACARAHEPRLFGCVLQGEEADTGSPFPMLEIPVRYTQQKSPPFLVLFTRWMAHSKRELCCCCHRTCGWPLMRAAPATADLASGPCRGALVPADLWS